MTTTTELTAVNIREMAGNIKPIDGRPGCFDIKPRIALRCKKTIPGAPSIKEGEIVHATAFDESGRYQNSVLLEEKDYWWRLSNFEIVQ